MNRHIAMSYDKGNLFLLIASKHSRRIMPQGVPAEVPGPAIAFRAIPTSLVNGGLTSL